jgi:hypothetical protein
MESKSSFSSPLFRRQETGTAATCNDGTQFTTEVRDKVCVDVNVAVFNSGLLKAPVVLANKLNKNRAFCWSWKEGRGR